MRFAIVIAFVTTQAHAAPGTSPAAIAADRAWAAAEAEKDPQAAIALWRAAS
jgi:hypothetical protein